MGQRFHMNAIVVVFVPTPEARTPSADEPSLQPRAEFALREANDKGKSSEPDDATPPFWTWFIKNPRIYGAPA